MGLSSSKTKTSSTASSTPLDQYAPYITQGLTNAQGVLNANQGNLQDVGNKALDVYNGLSGPQSTLGSIYGGTNPAQSTFTNLQGAAANDPSLGLLKAAANKGSGAYDSIGTNNPALSILQGMTNGQANGDTSQFYKDTLSGKYLNNNPYIDNIAQQGTDAALKAVNQRFAASGLGEGLSTPYTQAAGSSITDANNQLRYGAYNNELTRMGTIGGQSDSQYNATQDRNLSAATNLGSQYNQTGALRLDAQKAGDAQALGSAQALGQQTTADNNTALNAGTANIQSILSALGLSGTMSQDQLSALGASASLPFTGVNAYSNIVNGLTGKYGNQTGTSTSKTSGNLGQMLLQAAGQAGQAYAMGG